MHNYEEPSTIPPNYILVRAVARNSGTDRHTHMDGRDNHTFRVAYDSHEM